MSAVMEAPRGLIGEQIKTAARQQHRVLYTEWRRATDELRLSLGEDNLYQMSTTTQPPSRESLEETHETAKSRNPPSWEKRVPSNKSVQDSYYSLKGAPLSNTPTVRNPTTS